MKTAWLKTIGIAAALVAVDQLTKSWAIGALDSEPKHLVSTLHLRLVFNKGAAFGLGQGMAPIIVGVGLLVIVLFVVRSEGRNSRLAFVASGLVLGGAFGNLGDRVFRNYDGSVVDFVDFGWWPVFNVADAAIVIGVFLLVVNQLRTKSHEATDEV